ncbi:MAG: ATP-binding protein [Candidatus Saccharimonadales bacterium]
MGYLYLFVDVIIALGLLSLGLAGLLRKGYKIKINRLFATCSVLVAVWILSNHISNNISVDYQIALIANHIVLASSLGSMILLMQFVIGLADVKHLEKIVDWLLIPLWITFAMSFTSLILSDIKIQGNVYAITFGPLLYLYALGIFTTISLTAYGLIHGLLKNKGIKKRQIVTVGYGLLISVPLVTIFAFILPVLTGDFSFTQFGLTPLAIIVIALYYSVVKYQLFDIRLAAVRAMAYVLSLATLSAIYYYVAYLVSLVFFKGRVDSSVSISPINIVLALILAFIFQPVKRFFDRVTNGIFYKDNYNTDDFFARLNNTLTQTTEIRGLLTKVSYTIEETLKAEQAFFFIYTNADGHYLTAGTDNHNHIPKHDAILIEQEYDGENDVIVESLLEEGDIIKRMMLSHRIEIILPLIEDGSVIGYFCLGEHKTSGYTSRDTKVLSTISSELIVAIKNALAVEEIREINRTLQQRINNATRELRATNATLRQLDKVKDEFVSIASHQLRTPLTSVKGYLSMVLEGDTGKITKVQHQLLNEAFLSSERMVRLINDFLNVSRIQTGKFVIDRAPTDLSTVVEQEIESLKPNSQARNIKLIYKKPKNYPILNIDEGKIRQVIMNFADNAIYYSRDNSAINIKLSVEANNAVFTVKDTGIGVPKSERDNLFGKFYRATNARKKRPDGTGVGLYLAKKVVDAHEGELIFESVEDKGSIFGFKLPIAKNS